MAPFHYQTRVCYTDIDEKQCLTLSSAMRSMQEAAVMDSDRAGYSFRTADRTRVVWMLAQWHVRMLEKVQWDEFIRVITWPKSMDKVTSTRCFQILNQQEQVIAIAESLWFLVNVDTGRVARIQKEVADSYELVNTDVFDSPSPAISTEIGELTYSGSVLRRDIDTNHHVNNLVYLEYAREALPLEEADRSFSEVVVRYHRQLVHGDEFQCYYKKTSQGHLVQICKGNPALIHCSVLFVE